jgi:hypothetical protein
VECLCGTAIVQHHGRGGQARMCPACALESRRRHDRQRQERHALALVAEMIETVGPRIDIWRREVMEAQAGACNSCAQRRVLHLLADEHGTIVGLCLSCFEARRRTR